jgi:hypothetical protein
MSQAEVLALVARLDPGAEVVTTGGALCVVVSAAMTSDGVDELMRAAPGIQVAFGADSPLYEDMVRAMDTQDTSRLPKAMHAAGSYELDDLEEDGSWKTGREPPGWGELP